MLASHIWENTEYTNIILSEKRWMLKSVHKNALKYLQLLYWYGYYLTFIILRVHSIWRNKTLRKRKKNYKLILRHYIMAQVLLLLQIFEMFITFVLNVHLCAQLHIFTRTSNILPEVNLVVYKATKFIKISLIHSKANKTPDCPSIK